MCNNIEDATSIAYGQQRFRVITLNGELIEISGLMSGGGIPRKGGMSSQAV